MKAKDELILITHPIFRGQWSALGGAVAMLTVMAAACESSPQTTTVPPEPPPRGASLVVGSSVDQWSLLVVPREGGVVQTRSLAQPEEILATGRTDLPASAEAHSLADGLVVLRADDGSIYTYDPRSDVLARAGEVPGGSVFTEGGSAGLYFSPDGVILEVSRDGVWRYDLDDPVLWAAPVEGGVLVLLAGDGETRTAWLLRREADRPAGTGEFAADTPGVVTAWGHRAVLASGDRASLLVLTISPIERTAAVELGGRVLAVSVSPSTHELYVALDTPPRLEAVNRFDLSHRVLLDLERPARDVRPSLFGDAILTGDGESVYRVPVGGGRAQRVPSLWRADLPLGLPDGRVLAASEAGAVILDIDADTSIALAGDGLAHWWLAVPWNPSSGSVAADRIARESVPDRPGADLATDGGAEAAPQASRTADAPGAQARAPVSGAREGPPPGFYAIVGSARQPGGIRTLTAALRDAGFGTRMQSFPDEAGRTWYRGLVGPYPTRSEAEAASRQLLRERRLEAWVTEIGAPSRPEEGPA